MAIPRK